MTKIVKPAKLHIGDTIGIVATSFPFPTDEKSAYFLQYKKAVHELENMGFRVKEGKNLRKIKWWFAGSPQDRAEDINTMFADPEVKAIIVHEGGQSAIAVLEFINYELVKQHPKPFIGFSDVTHIHTALFTKTGMVGFHAGLLTYSLGRVWDEYLPGKKEKGKELLFRILTSDTAFGSLESLTQWECWREGKAKGRLFGGNLSALSSLVGTTYFPRIDDLKGCILFWEIDNTPSYRIEKGLYQLKYAGLLDIISAMVVGKLPDIRRTAWEGLEEPALKDIVMEVVKNYDFPVLGEVDFGHKTVDIPMPIGIQTEMDATLRKIKFLESAVK